MDTQPPICKFCKHARFNVVTKYRVFLPSTERPVVDEFMKCAHPLLTPEAIGVDVVTGQKTTPPLHYCTTARKHEHLCSMEGKFFEHRYADAEVREDV